MSKIKLAVVGSRSLNQIDLSRYLSGNVTEVISGGATGVDTLAESYARKHGIPFRAFHPDYQRYGRRAPLVRNRLIADACDQVGALWDGLSRGTWYTVNYARQRGKPVEVYQLVPSP